VIGAVLMRSTLSISSAARWAGAIAVELVDVKV